MFGKKKKFIGKPAKEKGMSIKVSIRVEKEHEYGEENLVSNIEINQRLLSSSDAKIKDIKGEIEEVLSEAFEKTEKAINVSPILTDGYHQESREEDNSNEE